jgi:hypothetical protein
MMRGVPVVRSLVFVLISGETVVDWGDGRVQDVLSGEFIPFEERDYCRPVTDSDLENLKRSGRVDAWDDRMVFLRPLPDPPRQMID